MKRLSLALLLLLASATAARADPITAAITGIATWYASIGVVGQLLVSVAISAASFGIQYLISAAGQRQRQGQQEQPGVQLPEFDALLEVGRVYGTATLAGGVFFHKTVAASGSSVPDRWLFGLTLSEGVCDGLVSISINGTECFFGPTGDAVTAPWFDGSIAYLRSSFRTGTDSQAIDSIISGRFASPPDDFYPGDAARATKWTEFRQRGVCTIVLDMDYGNSADHHTELWGVAGVPQMLIRLRGLRQYDRTDPAQDPSDPTTWTWSDTATIAIEDYLCADLGGQVPRAEINGTAATESIAIDREYVPTLDGSEQRGRVNGLVRSTESPIDVIGAMAQQNRATISKSEGLSNIRADRPASAVATIHKGQWVRAGSISMQNEPDSRSGISGIVAQFFPAARYGQQAETAYPGSALDDETAERQSQRFCDSAPAAQRLAYAMMTENALGKTISGVFDISVLVASGKANRQLELGDVVNWDAPAPYDDMNGLYRVDGLSINADFTVALSLSGTSPTIINGWSTALETPLEEAA
ncbi:MAG: phage tail family protein [Devosia sp.]|uniref:hypothetical protein n=1 Tax=Devosia sp. TaxID=1871048 RepID=UPI00261E0EB7|nr:hypothetical protein [Devosia sp.]MDB5540519.1 phage tail family protein [Devosia sp.]